MIVDYCSIAMVDYSILFIAILGWSAGSKAECQDNNGRTVSEGSHYIPGPDTCTLCVCDDSVAKWCKAVLCSPPQDCKSFTVGSTCCEFNCLDDSLNDNDPIDYKGDNINARSIASTITAFLFFILIVFLINRLHKRNMSNGEVFNDSNSNQTNEGGRGIGFISSYMNFPRPLGSDLYYGDHATLQIPLWKTYYPPHGDAPPPYDEAIALPHQIPQQFTASVNEISSQHRTIPVTITEITEHDFEPQTCDALAESTANQPFVVTDPINDEESQYIDEVTTNDDFREECENCKHDQELAEGYDDNIFPGPETMTLERRPQVTHEHAVNGIESRSSMTLPGDGRLRRSYAIKKKNKHGNGWPKETSLKENSTSDDEEP